MSNILNKLETSRQALLDLSTRNRLLSIPKQKNAKIVQVVDEKSLEIFRLLVKEEKALSFCRGVKNKDQMMMRAKKTCSVSCHSQMKMI